MLLRTLKSDRLCKFVVQFVSLITATLRVRIHLAGYMICSDPWNIKTAVAEAKEREGEA